MSQRTTRADDFWRQAAAVARTRQRFDRLTSGRADRRASPLQEAMWLLARVNPADPQLNTNGVIRFHRAIDGRRLRAALACVAKRHSPLRARFEMRGDELVPIVDDNGDVPWRHSIIDAASETDAAS